MSNLAAGDWVAIVDDHDSLRASLARLLRIDGIRSESFASAEAYLARPPSSGPCCLILDMQLPGMSGHDLAHSLDRERPPRPPIIFISAHDDLLASVERCCAPHGRLSKPFDVEALLALLEPLVRAARAA